MQVTILSPAEEDLEEGYRFYDTQAPGLGSYFLDSLYSDIDSLAYFGGIHPVVFGYHRLLSKRFPFAVYYRIIDDVARRNHDSRKKAKRSCSPAALGWGDRRTQPGAAVLQGASSSFGSPC